MLDRSRAVFLALALAALIAACSAGAQQSQTAAPIAPEAVAVQSQPAQTIAEPPAIAPAPLPFKGRLVQGDPNAVPQTVAAALSSSGPVDFAYREELTHDHYTVPLAVSAFDPLTYFGYPLGHYGVTAFASLSITDADRVLGDYTAKAHVGQSYTLYYQPTYLELEQAAREAVRKSIDEQIRRDSARLAQIAAQSPQVK